VNADELDYALPPELIAQEPLPDRSASRLLVVPAAAPLEHRRVTDLPSLLPPGALVVLNDTKVIPARLRGEKTATGGRAELLLVAPLDAWATGPGGPGASPSEGELEPASAAPTATPAPPGGDAPVARWEALGRASKGLKPGDRLAFPDAQAPLLHAEILGRGEPRSGELIVSLAAADGVTPVSSLFEAVGDVPLPPYVRRPAREADRDRYQTVYARAPGAVAAPTAGLHLTDALLGELDARGHQVVSVTLHVGPGTFSPLRSDDLDDHVMHAERYEVTPAAADAYARARRAGRAVVAIGTTVVRTLESAASPDGRHLAVGRAATDLFIKPPYRYRAVDGLFTNFHLPRSTLLALVMAFRGVERVREAYRVAVAERYRFFSYGDAMWLPPTAERPAP